MLGSSRQVSVYGYGCPVDLRKGYDGLCGLVVQGLGRDPLSGDLFLFVNRRRTLAKVLLWDGTGLCIFSKRLEQGRFAALWKRRQGESVRLSVSELRLFLEGCPWVGKLLLTPPDFSQIILAKVSGG